ncbi:hypothetical protein D3C81_2086550 [compost metagenome]
MYVVRDKLNMMRVWCRKWKKRLGIRMKCSTSYTIMQYRSYLKLSKPPCRCCSAVCALVIPVPPV